MPFTGDERQISLEEVVSAAVTHELPVLVERLARERAWGSLVVVFGYAGGPRAAATVDEVRATAESLRSALGKIPVPKRPGAALTDQMRAARIAAGEALLARLSHPPLGDLERRALRTAAEVLAEGGDHRRAAAAYEELGDDARAADAYGAIGDLDQMEASLEREDARLRAAREALDQLRSFESLMAAGQRRAALEAASRIPGDLPTSAGVRQRARDVESRLVRERAVTLRSAGAGSALLGPIRFAAVPATLGRELLAEVPVRDPSVSRRHAVIAARDGELHIEDAGSRAGVRVGGAALAGAPAPARRGRAGPRPRLPHPLPVDRARARDPARRLGPGPATGGSGRPGSLPARGAHPRRRRDLAGAGRGRRAPRPQRGDTGARGRPLRGRDLRSAARRRHRDPPAAGVAGTGLRIEVD